MSFDVTRIIATIAFAGTLAVNAMANLLPINGLNTGQVSDLYPSLFTPAGVTFSIWSVIYLLLIGFIIFSWTGKESQMTTKLLPFFILSCVLNATWIIVWHYLLIELSVVVMSALLLTLVKMFSVVQAAPLRPSSRIFLTVPFTIYLAWICVATIANISALLVSIGWAGFSIPSEVWTVVMMAVATGLALIIFSKFRKYEFLLVVMWALSGIALRWWDSEYRLIVYGSLALIVLLAAAMVYKVFTNARRAA